MNIFKANKELKPGIPCGHPGCCDHVSHPCEGCGRIACGLSIKSCSTCQFLLPDNQVNRGIYGDIEFPICGRIGSLKEGQHVESDDICNKHAPDDVPLYIWDSKPCPVCERLVNANSETCFYCGHSFAEGEDEK